MNTDSRSENAITTFKTFLSDAPIPTDAITGGNPNTNEPRSKPYDYVMPSFSLATLQTNLDLGTQSFPNGLVFDSRLFSPLSDVAPVLATDSGNAQHMAVLKAFAISGTDTYTNPPGQAPIIATQPASQMVNPGDSATFCVVARGDAPLSYQWSFKGLALAGATESAYTRTNVQAADTGPYSVQVTNLFGAATSANATLSLSTPATGDVVAQWNFNQTNSLAANPPPAVGGGTASLIGGTTATWASGITEDAGPTNAAWNTASYPAQSTGNKTAGVQFKVSTVGRKNLTIRWSLRASNTGSKYTRLLYSTNGVTFQEFPAAIKVSVAATFENFTNSLTGFPGVENNPDFAFRIVSEFESTTGFGATAGYVGANGTYGTAGTLRYDLVTVLGSPLGSSVPTPATLSASSLSLQTNWFSFDVTGLVGGSYAIQTTATPAQSNWVSLVTNTVPFTYQETNSGLATPRFFRAIGLP